MQMPTTPPHHHRRRGIDGSPDRAQRAPASPAGWRVALGVACQDNGALAQSAAARGCAWYPSGKGAEGRFVAGTPSEPRHHKDTTSPLPSRRCSTSPEQEPRHTAGPPDTRERGEVRSRAAGRTWADAHAEGGISPRTSPRVTGLRGGCPIKISVLLKLVCPIRLAGGCWANHRKTRDTSAPRLLRR